MIHLVKSGTSNERAGLAPVAADIDTFSGITDPRALAVAIVDTVISPLVVLDHELRIVTASRSFYVKFGIDRQATQGRLLHELGTGEWDIPELRSQLEKVLPERGGLDGYEVERDFPGLGRRTMQIAARQVHYDNGGSPTLLLSIDDVTDRRILEQKLQRLLEQKDVLLQELQHRVANSLAIIASILLLKAKTVESPETRQHLQDAHDRVISLATVQNHLHATGRRDGSVEVAPYLTKLCDALSGSMILRDSDAAITVEATKGSFSSSDAISLGLVVTELVINSLKHAFHQESPWPPRIVVTYRLTPDRWTLSVADNGTGIEPIEPGAQRKTGLGRSIVDALANQLGAHVAIQSGRAGTTTTIVCRTARVI